MISLLLYSGAATGLLFIATYLLSLKLTNVSIIDSIWGLGFIVIAIQCCLHGAISVPLVLVSICTTVWGTRLSTHILQRTLKSDHEDERYGQMRNKWGAQFWWVSFFTIFVLQWLLQLVIALPIIVIASDPLSSSNAWLWLGLIIWLLGFSLEVTADAQLTNFIATKKSTEEQIMKYGVWSYSRHPNYLGEATLWWGIWVTTFSNGMLWTIIAPLTITILVRFISGVPLLEQKYASNPEFQRYAKKTPIFLPFSL